LMIHAGASLQGAALMSNAAMIIAMAQARPLPATPGGAAGVVARTRSQKRARWFRIGGI
jgi:hypothetical protein